MNGTHAAPSSAGLAAAGPLGESSSAGQALSGRGAPPDLPAAGREVRRGPERDMWNEGYDTFDAHRRPPVRRSSHHEADNTIPAFVIGIGAGFLFGWIFGRPGTAERASYRAPVVRRPVVRYETQSFAPRPRPRTDWDDRDEGPRVRSETNWSDTSHEAGWSNPARRDRF